MPELERRVPVWLWALAACIGALLVLPTLVVVPLSFTGRPSFAFPPESWSLRYYQEFFSDSSWYGALLSSFQLAAIVALLATALGTAASYALVRGRFPGKAGLNIVLLSPIYMPQIVAAIAIYTLFLRLHLVGTLPGFVLAHTALALPFVIVTVSATLRTLDPRLELAAASLGARWWTRLRRITLPLALPGILSGAVFAFVISFDEVVIAIYIQSPQLRTLPVRMFTSVTSATDPTIAAASTIILMTTTVLILAPRLLRWRRAGA